MGAVFLQVARATTEFAMAKRKNAAAGPKSGYNPPLPDSKRSKRKARRTSLS